MFTLRDYQAESIQSLYDYFAAHSNGNPIVVAPTGAGKTLIIAGFVKSILDQWPGQRILVLTHVKELVENNHEKLLAHWPEAPAGINSASLNRRDTKQNIIFASIQSVFKLGFQLGFFDLIIIDECHLLNPKSDGMYNQLLSDLKSINKHIRLIGLSATPYRLRYGHLIGEQSPFTHICYEIKIQYLIENGYLSPVIPKPSNTQYDFSQVRERGGEFLKGDLQKVFDRDDLTRKACLEIADHFKGRRCGLVFCAGVDHAHHVCDALQALNFRVATVTGKTPKAERTRIIKQYKRGHYDFLTNCDVLTTGFDVPQVDFIAALRRTKSPGLWVQMVGRGMRLFDGKDNCLVLDFAGNSALHGPIDQIKPPPKPVPKTTPTPMRLCPQCKARSIVQVRVCPNCDYEFPIEEQPPHFDSADTAQLLSFNNPVQVHAVNRLTLRRWSKPGKPDSVQVIYFDGLREIGRDWICPAHGGRAWLHAVHWWRTYTDEMSCPKTAAELLKALGTYHVPVSPVEVRTRQQGKYPQIIQHDRVTKRNNQTG